MSNNALFPDTAAAATNRPIAPGRFVLYLVLAVLAALLLALALFPASSPHAAATQTDSPDTPAPAPAPVDPPSFGAATPTEKFVQTFQQQVSQQMQATLAQSSEAQESRLRAFEQQQHELDNRLQALDQAVAASRASSGSIATISGTQIEAPRVNFHKSGYVDPGGDAIPDTGPGPLSALFPGASPALLSANGHGPEVGIGTAGTVVEDPSSTNVGPPMGRAAAGDANVAPHGFIEGRLLNGVVTQQGGPERESIVALTGDYQSANGFTADLDGCFALVQGRPEIATGRIDFKLSRLTCNFHDGASRTWDASGWLVDADGIRGVRAVIVDNTGKKVAVAAGGGAIGGIGQRLSQQQYEITGGPAGFGPGTSFAGSAARDALGGAASGAANALGQSIADYYNLYGPSLQVGGGTHVTVVLANDLRLPRSGREISRTYTASH